MPFFVLLLATDALYLRQLQHLLPTGIAWRTTIAKTLRKLLDGLAAVHQSARAYVDDVYLDLFPTSTRELLLWETQFNLIQPAATDAFRKQALDAVWKAQGGQSPRYLQDTVRAAGFDVYLHEWWVPPNVAPRSARDPRDYTNQPLIGTVQCTDNVAWDQAQCTPGISLEWSAAQAQCNRFLANDTGYLVNLDLSVDAPPPVPSDPATWPFFIYWGGATFPDPAVIPASRREEFERLLLKLCPAHCWIVTLVEYDSWQVGDPYTIGQAGLYVGREGP